MLVMLVTALVAVPLGVAAGIYLEEYAPKNWLTDIIEINVTNLAGVPSIIYGLLALGLFVYQFGLGQSIASAGLTLALLILPMVIVATREAIRSIPQNIREGAYACGATQWQMVSRPHHPLFAARHPDRRDHRPGPRHRRNGADHHHRRADLHRLPAAFAIQRDPDQLISFEWLIGALHRDADPDVQLDLATRGGVPGECRRRRAGTGGHDAGDECGLAIWIRYHFRKKHQMVSDAYPQG